MWVSFLKFYILTKELFFPYKCTYNLMSQIIKIKIVIRKEKEKKEGKKERKKESPIIMISRLGEERKEKKRMFFFWPVAY